MKSALQRAWRHLFARLPPTSFEISRAWVSLEELQKSPLACERLAQWLDVQIDNGESAADVIAYAADQCMKQLRIEDAELDLKAAMRRASA